MRGLAAALASVVMVTPSIAQQAATAGPQRQRGVWAQDYTGRAADPAVRFGRLANGMRYAIQHNETPKNAVSMRMAIGSGSLVERDEERGLAHYLEHMAFRGSTNVPDGEVVHILERLGLRFGADTNAGTDFNATTYQFDFPKADSASIDSGLMLFREIGGRLRIDQASVDAERGVILSEERLRASGNLKAIKAQYALTLHGTLVPARFPIGEIETIKAATAARIRRYYEANYRPENATIVVVGDVDPTMIEAQIKQRFGEWRDVGPADAHPVLAPTATGVTARNYVEPGVVDRVSLSWSRPLDPRADATPREQDRFLREIGLTALNLRLQELGQTPSAPFSVSSARASDISGTAEQTSIVVIPSGGRWRDAVTAVVAEQRRLDRDGIGRADIDRVIALLRPQFRAAADAARTRTDTSIADAIAHNAVEDEVYTSPAQDLAEFAQFAGRATPEAVTAAYRSAFTGIGPLAFRSSTDAATGDDVALSASVKQAYAAPLGATTATAAVAWPYTSFGTPGRVLDRSAPDAAGVTRVRFANGTFLAIKPTTYVAGGVSVRVSFGDGIVGIRPDRANTEWLLAFGAPAFVQGGTNKLTANQLQRVLEGHNATLSLSAGDTRFVMAGETRRAELPFQTQLLAAFYSDAAYRPEAMIRVKGAIGAQLAAIDSNVLAVMTRALGPLTHNGDARWKAIPDAQDLVATTGDDLPRLLRPATASPVDMVIVGDLTVDDAINAVATTFGALAPATRARSGLYTTPVPVVTPRAAPIVVTHGGRADQAVVAQVWPTTDYYSASPDSYALRVAQAMVSDRLVEVVREKLGLTYSPFATTTQELDLPRNGYFLAGIEVPAVKFDQFRQVLANELKALATMPITPDALTRAKTPLLASRAKARETNAYWAARIARTLRDPRAENYYRDEISGIEGVTAADVQRVLATYIVGKPSLSLEVRAKQ